MYSNYVLKNRLFEYGSFIIVIIAALQIFRNYVQKKVQFFFIKFTNIKIKNKLQLINFYLPCLNYIYFKFFQDTNVDITLTNRVIAYPDKFR